MSIDVTPTDLVQEELMAMRRHVGELERSLQTTAQQAAALRAELDAFNSAFDAAPIGMALVDSGGRLTRVNQTLGAMFGYTSDELTTMLFRDLAHPDEREEGAAQYRRMLAGEGQTFRCEKRYIHADGHILWLLLNVTLVRDEQSRPLHFWCQFEDITQRKQTELALQESEQRLVQFMEVLPVGVFVIDNNGNPFYANQAAQQLLGQGIKPHAALSQLAEVYHAYKAGTDQEYPIDRTPIVRALSGERSTIDDMEIRQRGRTIPLEVTAAPILDASGAVTFAIAIFTDITERRRVEEARRQSMVQDEIIRSQAASLQELSTPLIPISDQVLAMPLIGSIDSRRAQQVIENLLHGVAEQRAATVILDITGVAVVDTQVANALVRAAQAVQLLGAQVVLTGIRPEVAQTLVGLGVDLRSIITRATLQSGIAFAIQGR